MVGLLGTATTSLGVKPSGFNDMKTSHVGLPVRLRCRSIFNDSNLMFSFCTHRHKTQVMRKPCRARFAPYPSPMSMGLTQYGGTRDQKSPSRFN